MFPESLRALPSLVLQSLLCLQGSSAEAEAQAVASAPSSKAQDYLNDVSGLLCDVVKGPIISFT